jgi:transmembrane sensor
VLITSSSEPLRTVLHFETHQEQQSVELPDGSRLHLNAHTKLLAAFTALSRHIDLLQGEARFHVEKDRKRPFVVDTPHARVSALGTTFNVQVAARDTDVTLLEGRISVSKLVAHEAATSGRLELRAGQNVRIQSNGEMAFGRGRTAHAANAWPRQVMAFRHSKLSEVVAAVNRHRDNLLIIGDVRLNDMEVNGSLNVFESEPFWDSLEKAEHIRVERREDGSMVLVPARKMLD